MLPRPPRAPLRLGSARVFVPGYYTTGSTVLALGKPAHSLAVPFTDHLCQGAAAPPHHPARSPSPAAWFTFCVWRTRSTSGDAAGHGAREAAKAGRQEVQRHVLAVR